jgi:hypothetical protein
MEWTVWRTTGFNKAKDHCESELTARLGKVNSDVEAQQVLNDVRSFDEFSSELDSFKSKPCDPKKKKLLREARDESRTRLPDFYYLRKGTFYAYFDRDVVSMKAVAILFLDTRDRLTGLKAALEEGRKLSRA